MVNASGELVEYSNLTSNSDSEYKVFDVAYGYAFVSFEIEGDTFTLYPINYERNPIRKRKGQLQHRCKSE